MSVYVGFIVGLTALYILWFVFTNFIMESFIEYCKGRNTNQIEQNPEFKDLLNDFYKCVNFNTIAQLIYEFEAELEEIKLL